MTVTTATGEIRYRIVRDNHEAGDRLIIAEKEVGHVRRARTPFNGMRWQADFLAETFHSVAHIVREVAGAA